MNDFQIQLLNLLTSNAKLSNEKMAVMLGKTQEEVAQEIKELENYGVIMGYSAVINSEKLNDLSNKVSALIEVKISPQRNQGFDAIAEQIYDFDEVKDCYLMSGAYDLMVIVEGENIREVARFVSDKLSQIENVLSCATHFILKRYKENGHCFCKKDKDNRLAVTP